MKYKELLEPAVDVQNPGMAEVQRKVAQDISGLGTKEVTQVINAKEVNIQNTYGDLVQLIQNRRIEIIKGDQEEVPEGEVIDST